MTTPTRIRKAAPLHQAPWPNRAQYRSVLRQIRKRPGITDPRAIDAGTAELAAVAQGLAIALMMGDCAETFKDSPELELYMRAQVAHLVEVSIVLQYKLGLPVARFLRWSQFFKPRSSQYVTINGVRYYSYYGDAVNGIELAQRVPDPNRLLQAYNQSMSTHNLIGNYVRSGDLSLDLLKSWSTLRKSKSIEGARFRELSGLIDRAVAFMKACGANTADPILAVPRMNLSRELLELGYERSLTRRDPDTGKKYNLGTHMGWLGYRTGDPDGAHVDYAASIANPIGYKVGPGTPPEHIPQIVDKLDPNGTPGRLTFIMRFGVSKIEECLPPILEQVIKTGKPVILLTDPMHGNNVEVQVEGDEQSKIKTRKYDDILRECLLFADIVSSFGLFPGGLHLEATHDNVSECLGGPGRIIPADLRTGYRSRVDPRFNMEQAFALATQFGDHMPLAIEG